MKFTNGGSANMTSYKGDVTTTFAELVAIFGKPKYGPNADLDKTTCEWVLTYEDGTVATIYDWMATRTPMGHFKWHIGGYDERAVEHVLETIRFYRDPLVKAVVDYRDNHSPL